VNFPNVINASKVEPINNAIDEVNNIIVKYVGLLHGSNKAEEKWDELIEEFNSVYPFDSYIVAEPENYKNKINNAKLFKTNVYHITYDKEIPLTEDTTQGTEIVYLIDGKTILPTPREVNEFTFTLTYRYFSDFYQKLVGEINGEGGNGMLWWYLDVVLRGEIEYQRSVLADMKKLLEEYQIKISDYSTKKEKYKEQYDNAVLIFDQYRTEFRDVFDYYYSNAGD
jgi:hypothetical protein